MTVEHRRDHIETDEAHECQTCRDWLRAVIAREARRAELRAQRWVGVCRLPWASLTIE